MQQAGAAADLSSRAGTRIVPRLNRAALDVLVVDDDPEQAIELVELMLGSGFTAARAARASDALDLVQSMQPDMVLVDINLGRDDGLDLIDRIADAQAAPLVIAMSGLADALFRANRGYRDRNIFAVLNKPLPPKVLIDFLQKRRNLRQALGPAF